MDDLGRICGMKDDELKSFCGLKVTRVKDELVARVFIAIENESQTFSCRGRMAQ